MARLVSVLVAGATSLLLLGAVPAGAQESLGCSESLFDDSFRPGQIDDQAPELEPSDDNKLTLAFRDKRGTKSLDLVFTSEAQIRNQEAPLRATATIRNADTNEAAPRAAVSVQSSFLNGETVLMRICVDSELGDLDGGTFEGRLRIDDVRVQTAVADFTVTLQDDRVDLTIVVALVAVASGLLLWAIRSARGDQVPTVGKLITALLAALTAGGGAVVSVLENETWHSAVNWISYGLVVFGYTATLWLVVTPDGDSDRDDGDDENDDEGEAGGDEPVPGRDASSPAMQVPDAPTSGSRASRGLVGSSALVLVLVAGAGFWIGRNYLGEPDQIQSADDPLREEDDEPAGSSVAIPASLVGGSPEEAAQTLQGAGLDPLLWEVCSSRSPGTVRQIVGVERDREVVLADLGSDGAGFTTGEGEQVDLNATVAIKVASGTPCQS